MKKGIFLNLFWGIIESLDIMCCYVYQYLWCFLLDLPQVHTAKLYKLSLIF